MRRKIKPDVATAAAEFASYFPNLVRDLKYVAKRYGPEFTERYRHGVAAVIKEILREPKQKRGRPAKRIRSLDDDHSMLANTIDAVLVPAHEKSGAADPLTAAIKEAAKLEADEGRRKTVATIRKYYWQGRRAQGK